MRLLLPALTILLLVACGKRERPDPTEPADPSPASVETPAARRGLP